MKKVYKILETSISIIIRILFILLLITPFMYFNKYKTDKIDYIVDGNKIVDTEIIIRKVPIQVASFKGINLINIKEAIEKDDYIDECSIKKINSSKIHIDVHESRPVAKLFIDNDTTIIDYAGNFIPYKYNFSLISLNEIRIINTSIKIINKSNKDIIKLIDFINENNVLSDNFIISFDNNNIIVHNSNKAIKLGIDHIQSKLDNLKYFISIYGEKYKTIDLYDKEYITASTINKYGL